MENLAGQWNYQESLVELDRKLVSTRIELERIQAAAREETRKHHENTKQLLTLLQMVGQQRDEAWDLLNKLGVINNGSLPIQDGSLNSGYFSANNPSPDMSNASFVDSTSYSMVSPRNVGTTGPGSAVIDSLASGRALPQRGWFKQAVADAGPLLETLLLSGPLPQWRVRPSPQPFVQNCRNG